MITLVTLLSCHSLSSENIHTCKRELLRDHHAECLITPISIHLSRGPSFQLFMILPFQQLSPRPLGLVGSQTPENTELLGDFHRQQTPTYKPWDIKSG